MNVDSNALLIVLALTLALLLVGVASVAGLVYKMRSRILVLETSLRVYTDSSVAVGKHVTAIERDFGNLRAEVVDIRGNTRLSDSAKIRCSEVQRKQSLAENKLVRLLRGDAA